MELKIAELDSGMAISPGDFFFRFKYIDIERNGNPFGTKRQFKCIPIYTVCTLFVHCTVERNGNSNLSKYSRINGNSNSEPGPFPTVN